MTHNASAIWTAPSVTRVDEPLVAGERAVLDGFLDWYRATLLHKCTGLSAEQLAQQSAPPSNLSLLGLIRHMAEVERAWFRLRFGGQQIDRLYMTEEHPDADFESASPESAESDYAVFLGELDAARAAAAGHELDETFVGRGGKPICLRWVYVHMIEEYARHCGHADLIRERIDGTKGS
ncbi:MAG TPA: DinB family protein [Streptosporangiaceae bacterium]|nr:DinB family protein [Streptosporangiaceae bacterium]